MVTLGWVSAMWGEGTENLPSTGMTWQGKVNALLELVGLQGTAHDYLSVQSFL